MKTIHILVLYFGFTMLFALQAQQQVKYSYDVNGQLTKVEYKGKLVSNYQYDITGNRIQSKNEDITGLSRIELNSLINIHPNPVTGNEIIIQSSLSIEKVELIDLTGKSIPIRLVQSERLLQVKLPQGIADGIYLCRIITQNGSYSTKLIKQSN